MTGEMSWINQDGLDSNGEEWTFHAAIAKAVGGTLKPFDVYQGPYIAVGPDFTAGASPYRVPIQNMGCVRLWLGADEDGFPCIYREDIDQIINVPFLDEETVVDCAKEILSWEPSVKIGKEKAEGR